MAYTHLKDGSELQLSEYVCFHSDQADISDLVTLSPEKLSQLEQDSVAQEEAIYNRILEAVDDWKRQASRTLDLRKAREYLRSTVVQHTSNQWVKSKYEWYEISNMVYKMAYRISEETLYRSYERPRPTYWAVSWHLSFNTIRNSDYDGHSIAGQRDKRFDDKASAEKYLKGRIAAYAHLFTEISPPIPEEHKKCFYVNGVLLPGYTVEIPVTDRPDPDAVDDLLSYLDDDDMPDLLRPEEHEPPAEAPPPKLPAKKAPSHKHKRTAPTR